MNCKFPDNNFDAQDSMNSRRFDSNFNTRNSRRFDPDCNNRPCNCCESRKFCRVDPRPCLSPCPHPVLFDVTKNNGPVSIDPSNFRPITLVTLKRFDVCCLNMPFVKIDFNSLLHFRLGDSECDSRTSRFTITFDIVKVCNNVFNGENEIIDSFSITQASRSEKGYIELDIPVSHTTLDINTNNSFDCCRASYRVVVSKISYRGDVSNITLRDSSLSALAKSNC